MEEREINEKKNNQLPLVSVIVPVYNAEKYLKRCLDSIKKQTYSNLEILLVNDGSMDRSPYICDKYAANDERIHVIHQKNMGVSAARNAALEIFQGDYVTFVDSDDWVQENMVDAFVHAAYEYEASLITSVAIDRNPDGSENDIQAKTPEKDLLIDIFSQFSFQEEYAHGVVWGSLYAKEIILGLRFAQDLYVGEDSLFFAQAVKRSKQLVFLEKRYYNYVIYEDSALHGEFDERKYTEITAWKRVTDIFDVDSKLYESACVAYGLRCVSMLKNVCGGSKIEKAYYSELVKEIRHMRKYMLKGKIAPKIKAKILLASIVPKYKNSVFNKLRGMGK